MDMAHCANIKLAGTSILDFVKSWVTPQSLLFTEMVLGYPIKTMTCLIFVKLYCCNIFLTVAMPILHVLN